jgi:hypothetical protein
MPLELKLFLLNSINKIYFLKFYFMLAIYFSNRPSFNDYNKSLVSTHFLSTQISSVKI